MSAPLLLNCLIEGEYIIFPVAAECDAKVSDLKKEIKKEHAAPFKRVDARRLELWKPKGTIETKPDGTLVERFGLLGHDLSQFADKLGSSKSIFRIFPIPPPREHIHIIVKVLRHAAICPRLSNESNVSSASISDGHFSAIHQRFWQCGEDLFVKRRVQIPSSELGGDPETLELAVINLPEGSQKVFTTGVPKLLVIPIYETFWDLLKHEDQRWQALPAQSEKFSRECHATIVTGQPGIGKSVFLMYVLLRRLVNGMTTIYCDNGSHVHIFDHTGVRRLSLSVKSRIPELDNNAKCCALVNLGDKLKSVPEVFYPQLREGRVVVATPPSREHLSSFCHEHPAKTYCMPTWEWGPLYFASLLYACKDLNASDPDHWKAMQSAYSVFRGIPRSCFRSLDPDVLESQKAEIKSALDSVTFLDDFARATSGQLPIDSNTSHHLVRVEPVDTKWLTTRTDIKSNYIAELIFERIRMLPRARFPDKLMEYLANTHNPIVLKAEEEDEGMDGVQDEPDAELDAQENGKKRKRPASTSGKPVPKRAKPASTLLEVWED